MGWDYYYLHHPEELAAEEAAETCTPWLVSQAK
jgi:hypothetical protein